VALLNLAMAAVLLNRTRRVAVILAGAGAVCASVPLLFLVAPRLETASRARLWTGFELVAVRDTVYGNLAVTRTGELRSLYANGSLLANAPDPAAAEEAMLPALLEHPAPARVLVLGGCANGLSLLLEQPSVRSVDCVELDPGLIELARATLAAPFPDDGRLHLQMADGRQFLASSKERYDAILVNLPDPSTAQINRYYTVEFFRLAKAHLAQGGLIALQLRSSEETISPALAEFLRSIRRTLGEVFPRVAVIPGETLHLFASADAQALTEDAGVLVKRMHARGLQPQYVSEYILPYRMTAERMEGIHRTLAARGDTPVNHDLAPVAYAFSTLLWSTQFSPRTAEWFQAAAHLPFRMVLMAECGFVLVALVALWFVRNRRRTAAAASTASAGFTLMALEIVLLLGYESVYGTVYSGLAILIGVFMAGMAVGGWLGLRRGAGRAKSALAATQAALAVAAPVLVLAVWAMDRLGSGLFPAVATSVAAQIAFPALALGAGALGGFQFPVAAELFLPVDESRFGLGTLYALDLLGGCVGALLLAGFLIPVYGFVRTAALVAVVNAAAMVLAARAARR
jgi:spermidine synthase